jgi:hypothetical protein
MRRFAALGTLLAVVAALLVVVVLPASAAEAASARCDEGHWPATVQGKPETFKQGGRAGYYVWHDSHGWHLRTTTPKRSPHPFTGTITSSGNITLVRQFRDEGRDSVTVRGTTMTFKFATYSGVDGIDFRVGCTASLRFSLKAYDRLVSPSRIWLGARGTAPANPFTVRRVA